MKRYFKHKLNNIISISKIVTIHYFEFEKNFRTSGESHDFWELVYAQKEGIICTRDGEQLLLSEGEILFHKPGEFHTLAANGEKAPTVMIVSFVSKSATMELFEGKKLRITPSQEKMLYQIIDEGKRTFDIPYSDPSLKKMPLLPAPPLGAEQLIKNYLEILLVSILRSYTDDSEDSNVNRLADAISSKPVKEIISLLESSVYSSLTVNDICARTSYGRAYLFRIFKNATGRSIMHYYMELKIEIAKQLLRENDLSVKEISDRLAFSEPNYFTKTFKRISGMTPSAYKRRCHMLEMK